jgi:hypothetical protein
MHKLRPAAACLLFLYPSIALAQTNHVSPPEDRLHDFVYASILSPGPYVLDLGSAVIDDMSKFPREWEAIHKAFAKRFAARLGSGFTSDVVGHTAGAILRHRVLYEPCGCNGGWSRTRHAIGRGFLTRHDNGRVVFHVSIFVAKFSAAAIGQAWYPSSYNGIDILREGFFGVGANGGLNVLREFGPDLMRIVGMR